MERYNYFKKVLLFATKLGIGSSLAILAAHEAGLDNAISAGTIALLTLMTTKWGAVRLSLYRWVTFVISVCIAWAAFRHIDNDIVSYGVYLFFTVLVAELIGQRATISVNAVVGAHLLISHDFSWHSILNEMALVAIGIFMALILNFFHGNYSAKKSLIAGMRDVEERLQAILKELASYLSNEPGQRDVWEDIRALEHDAEGYVREACEYQENTFQSHPAYYIDYFEMRCAQCQVLHNLHYEMKKIRNMPRQADIVAEYMRYLTDYVVEMNVPHEQLLQLERIFAEMKKEELPKTPEEFESRALLYHILMDIEEFLVYKRRFVDKLDEAQMRRYWNRQADECKASVER